MKTKMFLAGMLLTGTSAFATQTPAQDSGIPDICKSVANYAAQTLALGFQDGTVADGVVDPQKLTLKVDYKTYPTTYKALGDCEEENLNPAWCQVAGGQPVVFEADVQQAVQVVNSTQTESFPLATVIVTYNRGGCWVDQVTQAAR
jgi:hypothetical protein